MMVKNIMMMMTRAPTQVTSEFYINCILYRLFQSRFKVYSWPDIQSVLNTTTQGSNEEQERSPELSKSQVCITCMIFGYKDKQASKITFPVSLLIYKRRKPCEELYSLNVIASFFVLFSIPNLPISQCLNFLTSQFLRELLCDAAKQVKLETFRWAERKHF